jgi:hypothetical protein
MSLRLDPDDVDLIARRVFELLRQDDAAEPARLVDAQTLAGLLGVTRAWVYAHAEELAAVRLGGPRGRLRFDVRQVVAMRETRATTGAPRARSKRSKVPTRGAKLLPIDP